MLRKTRARLRTPPKTTSREFRRNWLRLKPCTKRTELRSLSLFNATAEELAVVSVVAEDATTTTVIDRTTVAEEVAEAVEEFASAKNAETTRTLTTRLMSSTRNSWEEKTSPKRSSSP